MIELDLYYWGRFLASVVGVASWGYLVLLTYPFIRRQTTFKLRLFLLVVMIMLVNWTLILFLSSVYNLLHPARVLPDPLPLALGIYLNALVATSGVTLAALFPRTPTTGGEV